MSFPRFDPHAFATRPRPLATVATVATTLVPSPGLSQESQLSQGCSPETETNLDERLAMALYEGGIPLIYAPAFAVLQMNCPGGASFACWEQAVDDAGRLLDQWGFQAERLGWSATDLIGPATSSLAWAIHGQRVLSLSASRAILKDGRQYRRQN